MIYTKRLDIREMVFEDYKEYYNYAKDEEVAKMAGFKPVNSMETAKNLTLGNIYRGDTYSIFLKGSNDYIGTCNIYKKGIRKLNNVYTLGISLAKKYWGCGLGRETIEALVKYAFKYKKAEILEMTTIKENYRSRKMIESLGFKLEGIISNYGMLYDKTIYDMTIYSLKKEDYLQKV